MPARDIAQVVGGGMVTPGIAPTGRKGKRGGGRKHRRGKRK